MIAISSEAEPLIARYELGASKQVYKPPTITSIIVGSCLIAFACVWIIIALVITRGPLLLEQTSGFSSSITPTDPALNTFNMVFTILSIVFPALGLVFIGVGLKIVINAILNRHMRAVLCEYGVAYLERRGADAFRWEQVTTVLDRVSEHHNTTNRPDGSTTTSITTRHTYTVACKDGRRFIFKGMLRHEDLLVEEIQIAVAGYQKS